MTSIKVKFRPSVVAGKEGTIYYQIVYKRVIRQIRTNYRIFRKEWDENKSCVIIANNSREAFLCDIGERITRDVRRLNVITGRLESDETDFTADDIVKKYHEAADDQSFFRFMEEVIARLEQLGKTRTSKTYTAALNSFIRFRKGHDVPSDEIDSGLMGEYEAYLKKSDLKNGLLSYRRKKTGQRLHMKWEVCMQEIVKRHPNVTTEYLLPVITDPAVPERRQYENALHLVNRKLKEVAERAGLAVPLTMYVSRHSWASIARRMNIPLSIISEGMGHDSETTTQIYLASLDTSVIDRANELILKDL